MDVVTPGLLCEKLVEIGREFEKKQEAERRRFAESNKQLEKLVKQQRQQILEQRKALKEAERKHTEEIDQYRAQVRNLRDKVKNAGMSDISSGTSQSKRMKALTYQLIATRFELAEARKKRVLDENNGLDPKFAEQKTEGNDISSKSDGKENDRPGIESRSMEKRIREGRDGEDTSMTESKKSPGAKSESSSKEQNPDFPTYSKEMLFYAAEKGMQELVQKILSPERNCNLEKQLSAPLGKALMKACIGGNASVVRSLLAYGANVNIAEPDGKGRVPLHFAAMHGRAEIVKLLIDEGANIDALDIEGRSPIFAAVESNSADCVELLLFAGCDTSTKDKRGRSVKDACAGQERSLRTITDHKMLFWNCCTRGNRVYNQSRHEEALSLFKEALRLTVECGLQVVSKDRATIHYNCARAAIRLERYLLAVEHCTSAIDLDESFFKAWKLRGENHVKLHNFVEAAKDFERALDLHSSDAKLRALLTEARRNRDMDHYALFGINADADAAVIKKQYRKLCLKWHPDKNRKDADHLHRATNMFRRVQEAQKVLMDPCQRILYDMALNKSSSKSAPPSRRHSSTSSSGVSPRDDVFRDEFSGMAYDEEESSRHYRHHRQHRDVDEMCSDADPYSDVDASVEYPLVEEEDDLLGDPFGVDDFEKQGDVDDGDFSSLRNDRMWKLFEEYERSYRTAP